MSLDYLVALINSCKSVTVTKKELETIRSTTMTEQTSRIASLLSLLFVVWSFNAWSMSAQMLELDMMKQRENWKSQGVMFHRSADVHQAALR